MTRKSDIEFSATKGFVHQFPIARLAKSPETALLLHRVRGISLFCKVRITNKDAQKKEDENIVKPIKYDRLWQLVVTKILSMHSAERGVIKDAARTWGTTQSIAAMGSDTRDKSTGKTEDELLVDDENYSLMKDLENQIKTKTIEQQSFLNQDQEKTKTISKSLETKKKK